MCLLGMAAAAWGHHGGDKEWLQASLRYRPYPQAWHSSKHCTTSQCSRVCPGPAPSSPSSKKGHTGHNFPAWPLLWATPPKDQVVRHTRHLLPISLALDFPTSSEVFKHTTLSQSFLH